MAIHATYLAILAINLNLIIFTSIDIGPLTDGSADHAMIEDGEYSLAAANPHTATCNYSWFDLS